MTGMKWKTFGEFEKKRTVLAVDKMKPWVLLIGDQLSKVDNIPQKVISKLLITKLKIVVDLHDTGSSFLRCCDKRHRK